MIGPRAARTLRLAAALAALALAEPAAAQLTISNLLEGQAGNVPFGEPRNRTDLYDGLDLDYLTAAARVGLRFETHHNSEDLYTYDAVTRRFAEWNDGRVRVRAGNFYTILGRGLLHRSFDLPGVVLDQPGLRSRYAPSRDVDGALLEATLGPASLRAFSGTPNGGEFSPAKDAFADLRYGGQVSGGQIEANLWRNARLGAGTLRSHSAGGPDLEFGTGFVELDPLRILGVGRASLPCYFEYAQRGESFSQWWRFRTGGQRPHALYAAANLLAGPATLSAEWKDYTDFRLGTNDPPSLVREHSFALPNRATHVLNAQRERGFQLEGTVNAPHGLTLTANLSRSDGRSGSTIVPDPRYEERYLELHAAPDPRRGEATVFYARGKDLFDGIRDRSLAGAAGTVLLPLGLSTSLDLEHQRGSRSGTRFDDHYVSWGAAMAEAGSLALVWERTTDPIVDDGTPFDGRQRPQRFFAGVLSARLSERQNATLFVGSRRGGLACTAGTCYQVLSFRGVELRVTTRL